MIHRPRLLRATFCAGWLGVLVLAFRTGVQAPGTGPENLQALIALAYLGGWVPFFLFSCHEATGKVARFLAFTAALVLPVFALELPATFRLIDYRTVFSTPTPSWRRDGNRPDLELVYVRQGNLRQSLRFIGSDLDLLKGARGNGIYHCDLRLDHRGLRNPADLTAAEIAVVGDSFIEGIQVAQEEIATARLAGLLGRPVANLGRTGYGPQQELALLKRYADELGIQTCIWSFYEGNDLQDVETYETDLKHAGQALRERRGRDAYARCFTRNALGFVVRNWLHSRAGVPARPYTGRFANQSGQEGDVLFSFGVNESAINRGLQRVDSPELARVAAVLREAHEFCRNRRIELVVMFVPSKFRVYRELCQFDPDSPCLLWEIDKLPEAVCLSLARISPEIGFLDLTPRLKASAAVGVPVYLSDDSHWSAEGHRVAASAIRDYLVDHASPVRHKLTDTSTSRPELR